MRTVRLTAAAVVAAALLAVSPPARAITGNYEDDFVHDAVVLLVFYTVDPEENPVSATFDPFSHRCSGVFISPQVILTAGHCTEGVQYGRVYTSQSVAPNYDPAAFHGQGGDPTTGYPYDGGIPFDTTYNYGFADFAGFPDTHDAGLVILDRRDAYEGITYGTLAEPGFLDPFAKTTQQQDVTFTSSGYGLSYSNPVMFESFRERLMTTGALVNLTNSNTDGFNLQTTANPGNGKGGTCSGDSGGPVYFGDSTSNLVVSVTSFGMNAWCRGLDFSYRVDQLAVQQWIWDSVVASLGTRAALAIFPDGRPE